MPVAAVSFSQMGGNSLNYKVKAATGETYILKITAADSSSEVIACERRSDELRSNSPFLTS